MWAGKERLGLTWLPSTFMVGKSTYNVTKRTDIYIKKKIRGASTGPCGTVLLMYRFRECQTEAGERQLIVDTKLKSFKRKERRNPNGYLLMPERFGPGFLIMYNTLRVLEVFSAQSEFMEPFMMHVMKRKQL